MKKSDQIVIKTIRNRESKRSVKHPETEKRKHCESEDKTNTNRDKSTVENDIEKEKKKSERSNEVVKDKEMNVLDFTAMKISEEILKSLEDTQWVDDQMIYISLALKQNEINKATDKILFVSPSITQLIRKSTDRTNTKDTMKNLQINEKDWVFYPVCNNNQVNRPGGGTHWSLLVYCKAKDVYYHHDPINPTNEMHAVELIHKISSADSRFSMSQKKVMPPQQKNGYDCGPYIMLFANKIADNLVKGVDPNYYTVGKDEASRYRKELKDKIQLEMKKASSVPETKHQQIRNNKPKTYRVCYKWNNFKCWKGKNCMYDHPVICDAYVNKKHCIKDPCDLYHPQVCRVNLSRKVCRWGERCKFRHVHDNVQRNSQWKYENRTHHRIHQKPPPIMNTNHHQGGYGLSDERHQEGAYDGYDGHHNRYRDSHRNSTDFRMDRLTSRDEEILRKLMQVIRMETGNGGTADRGRPRY